MTRRPKPVISVIMPVHNEEKYIEQAIDSVINQTAENWELIIVNDASTDSTPKIVDSIKAKNNKISLINLKKNQYRSGALNQGIKKAKGKYICFLDGDDVYLADKLLKQTKFLEKNDKIDMVYSNAETFDSNGPLKKVEAIEFDCDPRDILLTASKKNSSNWQLPSQAIDYQQNGSYIPSCSVMIRKKIFKKIKFDEKLKTAQDYDLWFQLIGRGHKIAKLPITAYKYRVHDNQITKNRSVVRKSRDYILTKLKTGDYFK